jgi:hypothetical protein
MVGVGAGSTRQSRRDRTKTMKALGQEEAVLRRVHDESNASGTETTIHVWATPSSTPGAPRATRTANMPEPKNQAAPTRARAAAASFRPTADSVIALPRRKN